MRLFLRIITFLWVSPFFILGFVKCAQAQAYRGNNARSVISTGSPFGYNNEMQRVVNSMNVRRAPSINSVSRFTGGLAGRSLSVRPPNAKSKPFSDVNRGPVLSPYLNLTRDDSNDVGGLPNYYTFVRPALEQEAINQRQQQHVQRLGQEVQAINRQLTYQNQEAGMLRPTGHQTAFMNYSHYYNFGP